MNRQELKATFEQLFRDYSSGDGDAHVREGSVIVDQVINPLTMILNPIFSDVQEVVEQNNPPRDEAAGDLLDAIGNRFLISRTGGKKATADVRLLMESKRNVSVSAGTSVFSNSLEFQTTRSVTFAEQNFTEVTKDGQTLYESPDIPVEAVEEGPEYEVQADSIRTPAFALDGLVGVYNPSASSSARSGEPDERFRERLRQGMSSRAMDTMDGLRFDLADQFAADIRSIITVEPGDPEMQRDLIRTYEDVTTVGFQNKVKGEPGPNASQLFFRTTRTKLEAPTEFKREADQSEYAKVTTADAAALTVESDVIFRDDFSRSRSFQTAVGNEWIAGNTGEAWRDKDAASGIYINGGDLIFGPRNRRQKEDPSLPAPSEDFPAQTLPVQTLSTTQEDKRRAQAISEILEESEVSSQTRKDVVEAITEPREYPIEGYRGVENNTSPIMQHKISQPYGFRMSGTFWTTDDENPAAFTMARAENPEESSTVGRGSAKFRWFEGYGFAVKVGDGSEANVFVIDNAAAHRQLTVVGEEVVGTKLNFDTLSQDKLPIDTETQYRYEMTVGTPAEGDEAMTLSVRIWEDGSTRPPTPTVSYGAYTPENRREKLLVPSEENITTENTNPLKATQVGLGVSATGGTEYWKFGEFEIENIQQSYAQAIADIDVSNISGGKAEFEITARGKGHDGTSETYGHEVYIWNAADGDWEPAPVESPSYADFNYWTSETVIDFTDRVTADDKIRLLITSSDPHEGPAPNPVTSKLDVDYVTGTSYEGKEHTGGKADVMFVQEGGDDDRPSVTRTHTVSSAGYVNELSPDLFSGPIGEIVNVYNGTDTSGVQLVEGNEYRFFWSGNGKRGSMEETVYLGLTSSFVGNDVTIEARVHNQVPSVHNFINTSSKRKIDADILARHKRPVWLDLNLSVTGSLTVSAEQVVREFIRTRKEKHIDVAAIAAELIDRGIQSVDTDSATFVGRRIDNQGNSTTTTNFSQTRTRVETFVPGSISITTG